MYIPLYMYMYILCTCTCIFCVHVHVYSVYMYATFSDVFELVNTGVWVSELISLVQPLGATRYN